MNSNNDSSNGVPPPPDPGLPSGPPPSAAPTAPPMPTALDAAMDAPVLPGFDEPHASTPPIISLPQPSMDNPISGPSLSSPAPPPPSAPTPPPPSPSLSLGSPPPPPAAPQSHDDLIQLKQQVLQNLAPLVDKLQQTPEEKFKTTMMMLQASDNAELVKEAYETANKITDEKARAQALLDVVNEINYFTHPESHEPEHPKAS